MTPKRSKTASLGGGPASVTGSSLTIAEYLLGQWLPAKAARPHHTFLTRTATNSYSMLFRLAAVTRDAAR